MKKWLIENSEKSEILKISEKLFPSFLISKFSVLPYSQNGKSDLKILEKNFRDFRYFRGFRAFDLAKHG